MAEDSEIASTEERVATASRRRTTVYVKPLNKTFDSLFQSISIQKRSGNLVSTDNVVKADLSEGYLIPERKLGITMHISEIIKQQYL